jgi:uncharacterized phage protein gp47/JayE
MSWGVTSTGFVRKSYADCKADLEAALKEVYGNDINVGPGSTFEKLIGVLAMEEALWWEQLEAVYNAMYPDTASGISLDGSVQLTGIQRKQATVSQTWAVLRLNPATTVNGGKRVQTTDTSPPELWTTAAAVSTPLATATFGAWATVNLPLVPAAHYIVTINGTAHDYVCLPGDTAASLLAALVVLIEAGAQKDVVAAAVITEGGVATLQIYVQPVGSAVPAAFAITVSANLTLGSFGAEVGLLASVVGPQAAPSGTITTIVDTQAGWLSVVNLVDATVGTDIETDAELRLRRELAIHTPNGGTVEALRTALLELDYVAAALVLENITDAAAGGIPAHGIHCIVDAPVDPTLAYDDEIAETIWLQKACGIAMAGTVLRDVYDSQGFVHTIQFSRPTEISFFMRVEYHKYSEEQFPAGGEDQIKVCAVQAGANAQLGVDILPQRFIGPIFAGVAGIETLTIKVKKLVGDPWITVPIAIGYTERAVLALANVTVVLV